MGETSIITTEARTCGKSHRQSTGPMEWNYEDAECNWTGTIDVEHYQDETWCGTTWTCPACGYFHEEDVTTP